MPLARSAALILVGFWTRWLEEWLDAHQKSLNCHLDQLTISLLHSWSESPVVTSHRRHRVMRNPIAFADDQESSDLFDRVCHRWFAAGATGTCSARYVISMPYFQLLPMYSSSGHSNSWTLVYSVEHDSAIQQGSQWGIKSNLLFCAVDRDMDQMITLLFFLRSSRRNCVFNDLMRRLQFFKTKDEWPVQRISRYLGPAHGWRSKRLRIAVALRKQVNIND